MKNAYIEQLMESLDQTQFYKEQTRILDYTTAIEELVCLVSQVKQDKNQLFFVGNGGSAAIASHMTADFMKNGGMKTYSLYDSAVTTCMGNDYGYAAIFARPLSFLGNTNDMLIAISSSGNSQSIVSAIEVAKEKGMKIVTLSGFQEDNTIKAMGHYNIYVPLSKYGIVESIHNLILQQAVDMILERDGVSL